MRIENEGAAPAGLSIQEFARQAGISRAMIYLLDDRYKPDIVKIGKRAIVRERPDAWLKRMAKLGGVPTPQRKAA